MSNKESWICIHFITCVDSERDMLEYDVVKNMSAFKGSSWSEYSYKDVCILGLKAGKFEMWIISPYSTIAQDKARIQHNTIDLRLINAYLSFIYNVTATYSHMYFIMELMLNSTSPGGSPSNSCSLLVWSLFNCTLLCFRPFSPAR